MTFDSGWKSHSALLWTLAAGHSTTGQAEHSPHQPKEESGSDPLSCPKPEYLQKAAKANQQRRMT